MTAAAQWPRRGGRGSRAAARPRGAHRAPLGQAALLPRVPHLRRTAAPRDPGAGADLRRAGAHDGGLGGAGARRRGGRGRPPLRRVGGVRAGRGRAAGRPAAPSRPRPGRGAAAARRAARRAGARRPSPTAPTTSTSAATTCTCRSGWTGAWSAGSRRGRGTSGRSRTPTTPSCASSRARPPPRCRTARCSTAPPACTRAPPARPRTSRPATTSSPPRRPSSARPGSARCSTTSGTASRASCTTASPSTRSPPGMHIELVRSEIGDDRLRAQLDTAKDLTRRAVEQLRSAIYALNDEHAEGEDLPSMLRRLSGVHMPDELSVEVRVGGKPVALPAECEQSLFRIAGEALFNTAVHGEASRAVVRLTYSCGSVRLTISDDGVGRPEEVRRSLRAASAAPSGEHRGLVNMQARARELGGTVAFRRARLGGLQVQVEIPVPRKRGPTMRTRSPSSGRRPPASCSSTTTRSCARGSRPCWSARTTCGSSARRAPRPTRWPRSPRRARTSCCSTSSSPRARRPTASTSAVGCAPRIPGWACWCSRRSRRTGSSSSPCRRGRAGTSSRTSTPPSWCARSGPCPVGRARSTRAARRRWCGRCRAGCRSGSGSPSVSWTCCGCSRAGCPTARSAAELFISETTVKFHVGNLMRKLMVSRRAEAVYAATKLGLL